MLSKRRGAIRGDKRGQREPTPVSGSTSQIEENQGWSSRANTRRRSDKREVGSSTLPRPTWEVRPRQAHSSAGLFVTAMARGNRAGGVTILKAFERLEGRAAILSLRRSSDFE